MNDNSDINKKLEQHSNQTVQFSGGNSGQDDNVNFAELWSIIWAAKWKISSIAFIFAVLSMITVLIIPDKYKSEVLLAPVEESEGGLGNLMSQFGGLASLAGVNIGKKKLTKPKLAAEILKSRAFIKSFIDKHHLLVPLMAAEGWNSETNELIIDQDDYNSTNNQWIRDVSPPKKVIPSDQEAHEEFLDIMEFSIDKDTNLITLSILFYSPEIAKQWVDWLVKDIDDHMKSSDRNDAELSIQYLEKELEKTTLAKMQTIFYQLIEEQTKTIMLANVRNEYVFKILDPAVIADEKYSPRRLLIVILVTLLGGVFGMVIVLMRTNNKL